MPREVIEQHVSAWAREFMEGALLNKRKTISWVKCKSMYILHYLLRLKRLHKDADGVVTIMHEGYSIEIDTKGMKSIEKMLQYDLRQRNSHLPQSPKYSTLGALMKVNNRTTAFRYIKTWALKAMLEEDGLLPITPKPAFFYNFWHHEPVDVEEGVEVWKAMVQSVQGDSSFEEAVKKLLRMKGGER